MREICFTYEQGRSAASSGSLPNQAVKHRRTVFEPERGEAGDQLEETEWGGWSFTPCPGTIGASCMGAARNALETAQQSSLSGSPRINKPTPRMEPCPFVSAGHWLALHRCLCIHVFKYPLSDTSISLIDLA